MRCGQLAPTFISTSHGIHGSELKDSMAWDKWREAAWANSGTEAVESFLFVVL